MFENLWDMAWIAIGGNFLLSLRIVISQGQELPTMFENGGFPNGEICLPCLRILKILCSRISYYFREKRRRGVRGRPPRATLHLLFHPQPSLKNENA